MSDGFSGSTTKCVDEKPIKEVEMSFCDRVDKKLAAFGQEPIGDKSPGQDIKDKQPAQDRHTDNLNEDDARDTLTDNLSPVDGPTQEDGRAAEIVDIMEEMIVDGLVPPAKKFEPASDEPGLQDGQMDPGDVTREPLEMRLKRLELVGVVNTKHGKAEVHKDPNGFYEVQTKKGTAGKFKDFDKARTVARQVAEMTADQKVERKLQK